MATQLAPTTLLSLPEDILVMLPKYINNIEDYMNIASTCRTLRKCMASATPNTILRLAAAQSNIFFRPSPHFLVMATARELGAWARESDQNEAAFVRHCIGGIDSLLKLALRHCGLTMRRIRQLYEMRMSIINPVTDIIDKCVGKQWKGMRGFCHGGASDACSIDADVSLAFFHLVIYGELFSPDFGSFLAAKAGSTVRRLSFETRIKFVTYCIPDSRCDPAKRGAASAPGPYEKGEDGKYLSSLKQNNIALTWVIRSSRWRPHFKRFRTEIAGCKEFKDNFQDGLFHARLAARVDKDGGDMHWRQRMWENLLICQGLEGLGMIRPALQHAWVDKAKRWREQIARLEKEPAPVLFATEFMVQKALDYPSLLSDLGMCTEVPARSHTLFE